MIESELVPILASRFKALSDPGRLELLTQLFAGERSVGELVEATGRQQPNVSQQLAHLARAGLVSGRRDGNRMRYRIEDPHLERICEVVCESVATARAERDPSLEKALERRRRRARRARG